MTNRCDGEVLRDDHEPVGRLAWGFTKQPIAIGSRGGRLRRVCEGLLVFLFWCVLAISDVAWGAVKHVRNVDIVTTGTSLPGFPVSIYYTPAFFRSKPLLFFWEISRQTILRGILDLTPFAIKG